jgi:hypothetical protein
MVVVSSFILSIQIAHDSFISFTPVESAGFLFWKRDELTINAEKKS